MKTSILAGYPILDKIGQTQHKQNPLNPSATIKIGQDPTALYWKLQGMVPSLYWIQQRGHAPTIKCRKGIPLEINREGLNLPKCRVPTASFYKMVLGRLQNGSRLLPTKRWFLGHPPAHKHEKYVGILLG